MSKKGRFFGELFSDSESVNPLDGLANLADVMLVLACGLMLALVINWNIDVAPHENSEKTARQEVEFSNGAEENLDASADFEQLGRVVRDPVTGKLYLIEDVAAVGD